VLLMHSTPGKCWSTAELAAIANESDTSTSPTAKPFATAASCSPTNPTNNAEPNAEEHAITQGVHNY
jgi:hypothetical protein